MKIYFHYSSPGARKRPICIYIKLQSNTIDLSTRLCGINPTNSWAIPQSLVLRSIALDWILIYRNWSIEPLHLRWLPAVLRSHARALRTKAQVICVHSKEKRKRFSIFYDNNMDTKSRTDSELSRVCFGEIP